MPLKFESGKLELESAPFVLRDVVDQAMDLLAPMAFGKGLEISARIDPRVASTVVGQSQAGSARSFAQSSEPEKVFQADPLITADSDLPVCDERQLNELAGAEDDEDFVNEVLQIFIEQAEHLASRLLELANSPDLLSSEAHKLQGAAGSVGAAQLAYFCGIVDNAAKKSSNSPIDPRAIADLKESLTVSVQEYRKRLKRK